jgi:hypothetical protein
VGPERTLLFLLGLLVVWVTTVRVVRR